MCLLLFIYKGLGEIKIMKKKYLTLILITLCIISLLLGAKSINILDVFTGRDETMHLMMVSRIPRLISTLVAGSAMSICGLIMQQISQNKFVSPTTGATIDFCTSWNNVIYDFFKKFKSKECDIRSTCRYYVW